MIMKCATCVPCHMMSVDVQIWKHGCHTFQIWQAHVQLHREDGTFLTCKWAMLATQVRCGAAMGGGMACSEMWCAVAPSEAAQLQQCGRPPQMAVRGRRCGGASRRRQQRCEGLRRSEWLGHALPCGTQRPHRCHQHLQARPREILRENCGFTHLLAAAVGHVAAVGAASAAEAPTQCT